MHSGEKHDIVLVFGLAVTLILGSRFWHYLRCPSSGPYSSFLGPSANAIVPSMTRVSPTRAKPLS